MRLLFINQSLGTGGAETFNKGLLLWLKKQGITINPYVTNETFLNDLTGNGIKTKHIPIIIDIIGDWKGFIKGIILLPLAFVHYCLLVIKNKNTDIILMSGFIEKILVTPVAKLLNIPVVWIEFASLSVVFNKFFHFPKFLYKTVMNLPSNIIVPSNYTLNKLSKETRLLKNKFTLIPCARNIDINNYSNIKTENNLVCCVSRLEKGKGQDLLLKSWQLVEKEILGAKLRIVGEGSFIKELKLLVRDLKLKRVEFTGFVPDSLSEIQNSNFCIFPTVWNLEGFGLVAIEAMALSKPVVCFNFGPLTEIVDKNTGILVESNNTNALANAIIKLLKSPVLRKKLGQAGRKKYLQNFTFDIIGKKYLNLIKSV